MTDLKAEDERLFEEKNFYTDKISEASRFIGFGLVAFYYGLVTANPPNEVEHWSIVAVGLFGVATLVCDYFQYLGAYFSVKRAMKHPARAYLKSIFPRRLWDGMFWVKQFTAIAGAISLGIWVLY